MKYKVPIFVLLTIFLLVTGCKGCPVENNTLEFLWELEAPRSSVAVGKYSLPVICKDLLYMEEHGGKNNKLNIYDLKTGNILWEDKDRDNFIEYIPQIIVTDKYIGVYVEKGEDSVIRIYKK